ncbi:MAG: thiosulfate sulfurtransferase GlpE [Venatoribacter sp.]
MPAQRITLPDAKALVEQGANIADIRDALSFQAGHIRSAKRVDNSNLNEFMAQADKNQPLIVCCYHGSSSVSAAQFFDGQGYEQVYSLEGGYEMWKLAYPELCAE